MQDTNDSFDREKKTVARRGFLGVGLAVLLAASAFFSGMQVGSGTFPQAPMEAGLFSFLTDTPKAPEDADLAQFWEVWELMEEKFVNSSSTDEVTTQERIEGAIEGLVRSYDDPYTVFLPPTDASTFEDEISGNFGGVGMEVGQRDGLITVIAPLPNTPASQAGIVAKDIIVKIDGTETDGMGVDEAVRMIRGESGTVVNLSIYRSGEMGLLEIPVTRAEITIPTTKTEKRGNVFIISLYSFNALAEDKMEEALQEFARSGAKKLVLDVRGNPGGYLQSAITIASYFVPTGKVIVSENYGEGSEGDIFRSQNKSLGEFMPEEMVVLIDGGSASASEIVAGALQEHKIATLMGSQSFGKGSVQELVGLKDGSSLKVTIARWFTPNGTSISDGGLTPDVLVERTPQQIIDEIDPQLDAAVKWLNGDKTVGTTTKQQ